MWYEEMLEALQVQPYRDLLLEKTLQAALEGRYYRGPWKWMREAFWKIKRRERGTA